MSAIDNARDEDAAAEADREIERCRTAPAPKKREPRPWFKTLVDGGKARGDEIRRRTSGG